MENVIYEQFIEEMKKAGFIKEFSKIEENYVEWSDDDEAIYIRATDCNAISIKGIRESGSKVGKIGKDAKHHNIYIKVYDYGGEEIKPSDVVRFAIIEKKEKKDRIIADKDNIYYTIYYHYPYRLLSSGKLGLKKGIVITNDKKLEIRIMRNKDFIKIGKLELVVECDKWFKNNICGGQKVQ